MLQTIEDQSIGDISFEKNSELNDELTVMPLDDKYNVYLQGWATLSIKKWQLCACCGMMMVHHTAAYSEVVAKRKEIKDEWKNLRKQFGKSHTDSSTLDPINKKNNKPYTSAPVPPKTSKDVACGKATKMQHTRGHDGYKCNDCIARTCAICRNSCRFVWSTE